MIVPLTKKKLPDSSVSSDGMLGTDSHSLVSGSDPSLTPPSEARSLASSPPRGSMTPEIHGINRHRDKTRRESKMTVRMRRAESSSYTTSPPSMTLGDASQGVPLPLYSTAPSASLLAQPPSGLHDHAYMSSYHPPLQEPSQHSQVYTSSPYQQSL